MDDAKFFASVRTSLFGGSLDQKQVDGCNALLSAGRGMDIYQLAYVLATALHETAHTMRPIAEYGRGRGREYGVADPITGETYYGRGYVQLTWKANYRKAGDELNLDLLTDPDLALQPKNAAAIIICGMSEGWFTGKKLSDYIDGSVMLLTSPPRPKVDYLGARRIVNGTDKAKLIAGYAASFEHALREAGYAPSKSVGVDPRPGADPQPPAPVPAPVGKDHAIAAAIGAAVSAIAIAAATYAGDVWHSIIGALS